MGLAKLLNEGQRAEVAALMLNMCGNIARIVEIVEQAASGAEMDEGLRQGIEAMRQLATALDFQIFFGSDSKALESRATELGREMVEAIYDGKPPELPPLPAATSPEVEEWKDTLD